MAKRTGNQFSYSARSWTDPSDKPDLERVNIRPRKPYDVLGYSIQVQMKIGYHIKKKF